LFEVLIEVLQEIPVYWDGLFDCEDEGIMTLFWNYLLIDIASHPGRFEFSVLLVAKFLQFRKLLLCRWSRHYEQVLTTQTEL
jgi:hypothetical protein